MPKTPGFKGTPSRRSWCPICEKTVAKSKMKRHSAQHVRPEVAQALLQKNAIPLRRAGRARRPPARSRSRSRSRSPAPEQAEPDEPHADSSAGEPDSNDVDGSSSFGQPWDASWHAGPPPEAAEGSGSRTPSASQGRRGSPSVTVEDVPEEEYEGEVHETQAQARVAELEEDEDRRAYEQEPGWEDDFDEQFWLELEAGVHEAAGHARKCFFHCLCCASSLNAYLYL
jgi:hypothetical protein